jgi:Mannosylglycerate hydrolase MGH1-like glycoside hydrolase domain
VAPSERGDRIDATDLARRAQDVLDRNHRGSWTCPSASLYPHQWLWDSCFVAIGLAHSDPARAAGELLALFRGQWADGMLPHMIFADDTSCITQPPVAAIAMWRVAQALSSDERAALLGELFGKLVAYHEWLYRERDPNRRGLVTLIHPWEGGLDTTPPWMEALARMPLPLWARAATRLHAAHLLRFLRRDTKFVPSVQRPTDSEGMGMLVLAQHIRRYGFELRRLPPAGSVLIEDLAFNSILAAANRSLTSIADEVGKPVPPALQEQFARTADAIEQLWDEEAGQYFSRDATTGELIRLSTIATFLPLFAGVSSPARATKLIARLRDGNGFWPQFPVPTVPTDAPQFREEAYWKGPTWINMNWMIIDALVALDKHSLAGELRQRTLDLVDRAGCFEYFSSLSGRGYGASEFSWTAALVLDLLASAGTTGLLA